MRRHIDQDDRLGLRQPSRKKAASVGFHGIPLVLFTAAILFGAVMSFQTPGQVNRKRSFPERRRRLRSTGKFRASSTTVSGVVGSKSQRVQVADVERHRLGEGEPLSEVTTELKAKYGPRSPRRKIRRSRSQYNVVEKNQSEAILQSLASAVVVNSRASRR
jgi:hypothetical protein